MEDVPVTCEECGGDALLDHLEGRLEPDRAEAFERHLAACARCAQGADEIRLLLETARSQELLPSARTDRAVEEAIRKAVAPVRGRFRRARLAFSREPSWAAPLGIAVAAAFAVVVLASLPKPEGHSERPVPVTAGRIPDSPEEERPRLPEERPPSREPVSRSVPPPVPVPQPPPPAVPERPAPPESPPSPPSRPSFPSPSTVAAAPEFGRVARIAGRAERDGAPLAAGDRVLADATVTCRSGTLLLEMEDGSRVALRAGSRAVLARSDAETSIRLREGEIVCSVVPRPERGFAVEVPQGSALVRGTFFSVRLAGGSASVTVLRGRVEARTDAGSLDLVAGERGVLTRSAPPRKVEPIAPRRALAWAAEAGLEVPGPIWILAADPRARFQAPMTKGRRYAAGSLSGEPVFAAVDSRTLPSWTGRFLKPQGDEGGWVTYTVELPETADWFLWARLYYPGTGTRLWREEREPRENDPNSFYVSVDGGPERVLGNLKQDPETRTLWYRRWHWGGDGTVEVGRPAPLPLGRLTAGRHTLRIRTRDAVETPSLPLGPRLDALCLTSERAYRPRDEDFGD